LKSESFFLSLWLDLIWQKNTARCRQGCSLKIRYYIVIRNLQCANLMAVAGALSFFCNKTLSKNDIKNEV